MFYFIASPIGNLGDITIRAKETLAGVDYVLAEDTRQTSKLLTRYNIDKKIVSFHQHSGYKIKDIVFDLENGKDIALVSDAGTPGLCDPGGILAEAFLSHEISFTSLPGASALTTLISLAPFPCSSFLFMGYFPKKKGREKIISKISDLDMPVFFFESPHRIAKTLALLANKLPEHKIFIGRELTKKFEELIFVKLGDLEVSRVKPMGEFVFAVVPPC